MHRCGFLLAAFAASCAGVSPDPSLADPTTLPERELTAADRTEVAAAVVAATTSVVQRRFDTAALAAADALRVDPRCARALAIQGYVQLHRASLVEPPDLFLANAGERDMRLATLLAPDDTFVSWLHAVFLADAGHPSAAAHTAELALARAADAPATERAALLGIAGTYRYELGEERAALPHLRAYVELRPDDATAHFRLGACLLEIAVVPPNRDPAAIDRARDDAAAAARAFARCAELAPGDEDAALAVATAHWRAAELGELSSDRTNVAAERQAAEARLRAIAERFPASAEPWFRLGVAAEGRRDLPEARTAYSRALDRDPQHLPALLNLAAMATASGDATGAASLLRRALDADATRPGLTSDERRRLRTRVLEAPGSYITRRGCCNRRRRRSSGR